jgi:division protein CdvB (Snf7/Vps24/ESCRT-III family)
MNDIIDTVVEKLDDVLPESADGMIEKVKDALNGEEAAPEVDTEETPKEEEPVA